LQSSKKRDALGYFIFYTGWRRQAEDDEEGCLEREGGGREMETEKKDSLKLLVYEALVLISN
jgi:hypothetical protein